MSESIAMNRIILSQEQIIQLSNCLSSIEPAIYCDNITALQTVNSITEKLIESKAGQAETTYLNFTEPETGVLHILLFLTPLYNTRLEVDEDYDRAEIWQLNPAIQELMKALDQHLTKQFASKKSKLPQVKSSAKVATTTASFDDITILYMVLHQLHFWMGSFEKHPLATKKLYTNIKNLYDDLFYGYPARSKTNNFYQIIQKDEINLYLDFERLFSLYQLLLNFSPQGSQTYSTNDDNPMFYAPALYQEKINTIRSKLIVVFGTKIVSATF